MKSAAPASSSDVRDAGAEEFSWLPGVLAEIARVAGLQAAIDISKVRGGARCVFPTRVADGHWLVTIVGRDKAVALCRHFAPTVHIELQIPKGFYAMARRRYYELRAEGVAIESCARQLGVSSRACFTWEKNKTAKREAWARVKRKDSPQLDWVDLLDKAS